jgi:RNA polymerase sigma factor (sigma-70 family)
VPTSATVNVLTHIYRTAGEAALAAQPDADLLRRFAAEAGAAEAAFAALLRRHGPEVLRICRAIVRDAHNAEDAFQATFLVLAARARDLKLRGPLGPWLIGVARRVAMQARTAAARRRRHERLAARAEVQSVGTAEPDLAAAVMEAVGRLPERFRAAVVLCDLEGLSYREAASRLGWTHGAVRNRLARGRARLRAALTKKGLAPAAAVAMGAAPPVPRTLAAATARAAALVAAGRATGTVSESIIRLMNGGLGTMVLIKLKTLGLSALTAAVLVAGACALSAQDVARRSGADKGVTAAAEPATTVSDAERIARLARAAQLQQEAGDVDGAATTLEKIERSARAWRDRLRQTRAEAGPPVDADAAMARLREADRQMARLRDESVSYRIQFEIARARNADLLKQIRDKDQELSAVRSVLQRLTAAARQLPEDFKGSIRSIEGNLATIAPGGDAGAAVGAELYVFRLAPRPEYVGMMVILEVTPHEAVGRLVGAKGRVKVNDEVAARLK